MRTRRRKGRMGMRMSNLAMTSLLLFDASTLNRLVVFVGTLVAKW
jgi:hypothetical protein